MWSDTPCIEWGRGRDKDGYGLWGPSGRGLRTRRVHRRAWEDSHGPIPPGLFVLHHCDNPPCYNVEHLFLGTHTDNMADMTTKGRGRSGGGRLHAAKTHCPVGHPYDEANTYHRKKGRGRNCRACAREWQRQWKLRRRA